MAGCLTKFSAGAVSWFTRQQEVVALCSTKAEYITLCNGVDEIFWIRQFVGDLEIVADA